MRVDTTSLVGRREIAAMMGVTVQAVQRWRLRGQFLEPLVVVSDMPLWRRQDVEAWARKTGRA